MRRLGVGAHADHLGAGVLEVLVLVAEGARFLRAARRVVLRIEVEDDRLLAAVVAEPHRATAPVREREVGRRVADADAGGAATEQVEESHACPDTIITAPGQPAPAKSTPIAGATGCPRDCVLEPVVAPEELVADHGRRRAEDAEGDRPLRLGAETRLRLGRPGGFDQRAARAPERVEDGGDRFGARDVAVLGEVGVEYGAHEVAAPELGRRRAGHARDEQARAREDARAAEGQPVLRAQARQVAPHVTALRRVEVEGRVVPALALEHGPEEEGLPLDPYPQTSRERLDPLHGRIGVGAGELEPELEHRSAHATHEGTAVTPTQHLFSARRRCDDPAAMAQRALAALALGLVLAAPAWPDAASVAAHLEGEKAECDLLLGLCRAANRAARFAQETPPAADVLATRHARDAELRAADALAAGRVLKDKHGGKKLKCFDDPACAFVKARLFR